MSVQIAGHVYDAQFLQLTFALQLLDAAAHFVLSLVVEAVSQIVGLSLDRSVEVQVCNHVARRLPDPSWH